MFGIDLSYEKGMGFSESLRTKNMIISKEAIRCKLETDGTIVEQFVEYNYFGANITSSGNLVKYIKSPT